MHKFDLGNVVATPAPLNELEQASVNPLELIVSHSRLDRGCHCAEDQALNERAVVEGARILSAFVCSGIKFYLITEWDRSSTCILLPSEY